MDGKVKGTVFLALAIVFEVISTTSIKLAEGFTIISYSIVAVIAIIMSLFFLAQTLNYLPLSVAYAVWVGIGTALIYVISIFIFNEPINLIKIVGVIMVIVGVSSFNYLLKAQETITKPESLEQQ